MGKELTQWIACRVIRSQGLILRTAASGYTLVSNDAVVAATQSEFGKALCNKSQKYKNKSKKIYSINWKQILRQRYALFSVHCTT